MTITSKIFLEQCIIWKVLFCSIHDNYLTSKMSKMDSSVLANKLYITWLQHIAINQAHSGLAGRYLPLNIFTDQKIPVYERIYGLSLMASVHYQNIWETGHRIFAFSDTHCKCQLFANSKPPENRGIQTLFATFDVNNSALVLSQNNVMEFLTLFGIQETYTLYGNWYIRAKRLFE